VTCDFAKLLKYGPVALTCLLVAWTVSVSPYSKYGDNWAVYPALAVLPVAFVWHGYLIIAERFRLGIVLYGVGHILVLVVIWIYCLMKISKDAL